MSKKISTRTKFNQVRARYARTVGVISIFGVAVIVNPAFLVPGIGFMVGCGALSEFIEHDLKKEVDFSKQQGQGSQKYIASLAQRDTLSRSFYKTAKLQNKLKTAKTDRQRQRLEKKIAKRQRFQNDVISGLKVVK